MLNPAVTKPSLTIIMLTYNEVNSLRLAYETLLNALDWAGISDYEIIIASTVSPTGKHDGTPELAINLAEENSRVRYVHSTVYQGMAIDFQDALKMASKEYVTMIPGSNVFEENSMAYVLSNLGRAEGVIAYTVNFNVRPFLVRWISRCFVFLCNILFFLNIKYYNGIFIFPTKFFRAAPMSARGGEYAAEILIYLLKSGAKYIQVPQVINPLADPGKTFTFRNIIKAAKTIFFLFWKINFKRTRVNLDALRNSQSLTSSLNKKMKILFILKQVDYIDPMNIELLSALAKQEGYETFLSVLSNDDVFQKISKEKPDIVAYSAKTGEHKFYLQINRMIKDKFPNIFSIMGGPHCTFFPKIVNEGKLDAICIGEGDFAWPDFLRAFKKGESIEDIKNIYTKKAYLEGKQQNLGPKNENLDSLPFLDRELVYNESPILKRFPMRSYMSGRGCPNFCTYCFNHIFNQFYRGKGKTCNRYSVDRVCAELSELKKKYPTQLIKFYDDVFVFAEDVWFNEFIEKYPREVGLPFTFLTRADYLTESILIKLKKAGMVSISMSIEAGNDEVRNKILKRNMPREVMVKGFLLCHKHNVPTFSNTILAIPGTKIEHDIESLDVNLASKVTFGEFPVFHPYPKTELGEYSVRKGYFDGDYDRLHISYQSESPLNCFTKKEKLMQNNLSLLATVVLVFPSLRNVTVNYLIKLPLTRVYFIFYYFTKAYLNKKKIYPIKISFVDLIRNFWYSFRLESSKHYKIKENIKK